MYIAVTIAPYVLIKSRLQVDENYNLINNQTDIYSTFRLKFKLKKKIHIQTIHRCNENLPNYFG